MLFNNSTAIQLNATTNEPSEVTESDLIVSLKVTVYVVILLFSLLGNTFLIAAVKRNITGRMRTVSNLLIASIAASDIMLTVWSMPERITRVLTMDSWLVENTLGAVLCKMVNFTEKLSITVSVLHLGVLSIDRFLAVYIPYRTVLTIRIARWIMGAIWSLSAVYWSPILYYAGLRNAAAFDSKVECSVRSFVPHWRAWYLAFIVLLCIIMVVIPILYSAIAVKLYVGKVPGIKEASQRQKTEKMKRQVAVMVGVIILAFYACFLPYWVGWVSCSYLPDAPSGVCNQTYKFVSILFSYASTTANPIICLVFIGYFRVALRGILEDPLNRKQRRYSASSGTRARARSLLTEESNAQDSLRIKAAGQSGGDTAGTKDKDKGNSNGYPVEHKTLHKEEREGEASLMAERSVSKVKRKPPTQMVSSI